MDAQPEREVVDKYDNGQPHWASGGSQTYDSLGRSLTNTDALGRTSSTAYTPAAAQPLLSTVEKNPAPFLWSTTTTFEPTTGTPATIVDPNGALTSLTVDALGRNSKVWLPLKPKVDNPDSPSLSFAYTLSQAAPNAIKTTTLTGGGNVTAFELFDGLGRSVQTQSAAVGGGAVVKTTNFDDQGRPYFVDNPYWTASISPGTAFFTPDSENNIPSQVITTFDAVGRTLKTVLNGAGTLRNQTVMAYPGADRVDTTPQQGGTATSVFTNSLGQKKKLVQYLNGTVTGTGQPWSFAYDGAGRNTQMADPAGNDWTWTFDLLGRRTAQDDADSGVSTATYDLVGNMTSTTDARGKTVTTTYDELNRKKAMYAGDASGAILSEWSYDSVSKGRVTSSTSFVGSTAGTPGTAYKTTVGSYDLAGNPLTTTVSIPAGAPAFAGTSYSVSSYWHPDSTPLAKSVPSIGGLPAEQIRYGYDAWGHLGSVRGASLVLAGTDFSPIGQLSQFNRYDGTNSGYSTYGYDNATGAILSIKDNAVYGNQGHYVADRTFTRDAVGNVTSSTVAATHPQAQTQKTCYSYDGLRQLTRAWTPNAATACTAAPSAAAMGGPAPMWLDYAYDTLTGNRTSVTSRSSMGTVSTRAYEYPAAGSARPHAVQEVTGAAGQGTGAYGYDESGNQVSRPGQELTFNTVGKVSKVVAGSEVQSNVFDADGNLLLQVSSTDGASLFLGDTTLTQAAGSSVVAGFRTYSGAEGKPVAQRSAKTGTAGSVLTWLFTNLEGTVDVQTTANGSSTVQSYRDPFGAPIADSAQAWADGAGYMNKQVAKATALTNVGARTYDPALGKFVSVDPVIDTNLPQQNTGYAYSGNNPTTYTDPSGLAFNFMMRGDGGSRKPKAWNMTTQGLPPGQAAVQKESDRLFKKVRDEDSNPFITPFRDRDSDLRMARFYGSEQGQLLESWLSGNSPSHLAYGPGSQMTQDIRGSLTADKYRSELQSALRNGRRLPVSGYMAGTPGLSNHNALRDALTALTWESAPSEYQTFLTLGSFGLESEVVGRPQGNSAVVAITARNTTSLGSMLRINDDVYTYLNDIAPGAGINHVSETFTWTETISW